MRGIYCRLLAFLAMICLLLPDLALAAGGKAEMLVVVADKRSGFPGAHIVVPGHLQHEPDNVRGLVRDSHRGYRLLARIAR